MPLPRPAPGTGRWWVIGTIGCAIGVALAVWLGLANSLGRVTWTDTDYKVVDDRSVQVGFDVHRDPGQAVTCTVEAQDAAHGVVGVIQVAVPAGTERSVHQQVSVRTASRAVGGSVRSCDKTP
ncbi:protein of unknown function [Pedococcus dokdonensis]|uniref:DUF4307 domain-containing protein n=1 Tax=Pedococcus dokdonensis TaxID=443156 RepID=A0A1H0S580_9MICO|nr:DUF4307 domain-containing protein [Pedococcus dokdonensis]SDP36418.1 protein of unknown function [Pedococcus dokdonensis]